MAARGWSGMEHYNIPGHEGQAAISGWRDIGGPWHDVEAAGHSSFESGITNPWDLEGFTYHYVNARGDDVYFYIGGPFDDFQDMMDAIAESLDRYGIA